MYNQLLNTTFLKMHDIREGEFMFREWAELIPSARKFATAVRLKIDLKLFVFLAWDEIPKFKVSFPDLHYFTHNYPGDRRGFQKRKPTARCK